MGAVPTRGCRRLESEQADNLSFYSEGYSTLLKFRDRGDGAEDPTEMTSSSTKLHGSGLVQSNSDESLAKDEDIDNYLDAAIEEIDNEGNESGESPPCNRNSSLRRQTDGRPHSMGEVPIPSDSRPPQRTRPRSGIEQTFAEARKESRRRRPVHVTTREAQPLADQQQEQSDTQQLMERAVNVQEAKQAAFNFANLSRGMQAAAHGDKELLQRLVEDPFIEFGPLTRDSHGSTAIHKAAEGGHVACLQWLISQTPPEALHIQDADFITPSLIAITNGHVECLKVLIQAANGEVETFDKGLTLLHHAAYYGQGDCLSFLLSKVKEKQGSVNFSLADDSGVTPAHIAAQRGHLHCLQVLVEASVDVTGEDEDGQTPVDWANQADQKGCSHYLLLVDSCHTLSATVSKLQGHLGRVKEENRQLKTELSQVRRSQAAVEQEIRRECEETIDEVRKEYVDMTVRLMQKMDRSKNATTQSGVDERVLFAERRADEATAEAQQLQRKLEKAYRQIDSLMTSSRESSHSPPSSEGPLQTGLEATPLFKDYLSRTAHEVLQQQGQIPLFNPVTHTALQSHPFQSQPRGGHRRNPVMARPTPPPRDDSLQKFRGLQRLRGSEERDLHASSNTLHSSGSSVEI